MINEDNINEDKINENTSDNENTIVIEKTTDNENIVVEENMVVTEETVTPEKTINKDNLNDWLLTLSQEEQELYLKNIEIRDNLKRKGQEWNKSKQNTAWGNPLPTEEELYIQKYFEEKFAEQCEWIKKNNAEIVEKEGLMASFPTHSEKKYLNLDVTDLLKILKYKIMKVDTDDTKKINLILEKLDDCINMSSEDHSNFYKSRKNLTSGILEIINKFAGQLKYPDWESQHSIINTVNAAVNLLIELTTFINKTPFSTPEIRTFKKPMFNIEKIEEIIDRYENGDKYPYDHESSDDI